MKKANSVLERDSFRGVLLSVPNADGSWSCYESTAEIPAGYLPTQAQIDAQLAISIKQETDTAAANAHTKLNALRNMSPAQVQAWVATNVTTLPQAQDAIATLAIAVSILSRKM